MSIKSVTIFVLGCVIGAILNAPNEEIVKEIANSVHRQTELIDSSKAENRSLGMYYWHLGYRQGAHAVMESIKTGNTGIFSRQMEIDSLNLVVLIDEVMTK